VVIAEVAAVAGQIRQSIVSMSASFWRASMSCYCVETAPGIHEQGLGVHAVDGHQCNGHHRHGHHNFHEGETAFRVQVSGAAAATAVGL
jgi:hypothetical protein